MDDRDTGNVEQMSEELPEETNYHGQNHTITHRTYQQDSSMSTTTKRQNCNPCIDEDKQMPAAGFCVDCNDCLCAECYKTHRRDRPFWDHVLIHLSDSDTRKPSPEKIRGKESCPEHKNEPMKWHCMSHDQVVCDLCQQIDHRHCEGLSTLAEVSSDILSSKQLKQTEDVLKELYNGMTENKATVRTNRRMAEKYFKDLIEAITEHISEIRDKDRDMLEKLDMTCDTVVSSITSIQNELNALKTQGDQERVFLAMTKARSQLPLLKERLSLTQKDNKVKKYRYVPEMTPSSDNPPGLLGKIVSAPGMLEEIAVKTSSDTSDCYITGMARLSDDRLVLADYNNTKLKIVNMKDKKVTSQLKLDVRLWDLTKIDEKRIAVTTYGDRKIMIVHASDVLIVQKTIDKSEFSYCYGILCSNGNLTVSYYNPHTIKVTDMTGTAIQTIDNKDDKGKLKFGNVYYIANDPSTKQLYLSDYYTHKVTSMTLDGETLASFTHEHLKYPCGIAVGKDGRVFVCSYDSHKIYEISSDLSKGHILLDEKNGISYPHSLEYNGAENVLIVGSRYNNTLQVFLA